jgi:hypothetical protein
MQVKDTAWFLASTAVIVFFVFQAASIPVSALPFLAIGATAALAVVMIVVFLVTAPRRIWERIRDRA